MTPLTPAQYARECMGTRANPDGTLRYGRHPTITIQEIAGAWFLGDADWNLLRCPGFLSRADAEDMRTASINRAVRAAIRAHNRTDDPGRRP